MINNLIRRNSTAGYRLSGIFTVAHRVQHKRFIWSTVQSTQTIVRNARLIREMRNKGELHGMVRVRPHLWLANKCVRNILIEFHPCYTVQPVQIVHRNTWIGNAFTQKWIYRLRITEQGLKLHWIHVNSSCCVNTQF